MQHPATSGATPTPAPGQPTTNPGPPLKHSRSYLTLADLEEREAIDAAAAAAATSEAMDVMQGNGQQVTLVQGNQTQEGVLQASAVARRSGNLFLRVLPRSGTAKVVSLTPAPAAQPEPRGAASPRMEKKKGKKRRQAAFLSLFVLVLALFVRRDAVPEIKREMFDAAEYAGGARSLVDAAASFFARQTSTPFFFSSSSSSAEDLQSVLDAWNQTRSSAPLLTEWGERMAASDVSSTDHHPRPQLRRPGRWENLNGFWDFKVEGAAHGASAPSSEGYEEKILVPFSIESALSGVARSVGSGSQLVYRRTLSAERGDGADRRILHFGAVDWKTWVYVNGRLVGTHQGGYDSFSFDVTDFLLPSGESELVVVVWDPTEDGQQPHGKQWADKGSDKMIAPAGMWYTSVTGIWQTVWLETVPGTFYVESMRLTPSIRSRSLHAEINTVSPTGLVPFVKLTAFDEHGIVGFGSGWSGESLTLKFGEHHIPKLWSPDQPFLYNLTVSLHLAQNGEALDEVEGYFAMREISLGRNGDAVQFLLNGEPTFHYGVLDQGWWPDGLYTPPSEEALAFDIQSAKDFGFNVIRKHAKVESDRFYHLCDKLGIMVWQDMPSSSGVYMWSPDGAHDFREGVKSPETASGFVGELKGVVKGLYNFPSVVAWIPFNEGWGQFSTEDIFAWLSSYDPQRLAWVSGGNDFGNGAAFDRHVYPGPSFVRLEECRASVLGEFGGNGFSIPGHAWGGGEGEEGGQGADYDTFVDWGYAQVRTLKELERQYGLQMTLLADLVGQGLSGAIFTQLSDVESESNGILTYDRKVAKLGASSVRSLHEKLFAAGRAPKEGLHREGAPPRKARCDWEQN